MIVCGIEMAGSEARLVLLDGTKGGFIHRNIEPKKLTLANHENGLELRAFRDSLYAFLRENQVELVVIKKRNGKGGFAGGPVGFKMEAIAQLAESQISLLSPQTISASLRRNAPVQPASILNYQKTAFEAAFCGLP